MPATTPATPSASLAVDGGNPVRTAPVAFMKPQLEPQDVEAAHAVLKSGMLRAASRCAELETRFSEITGAKHGLTCSNGTTALQLAYGALLEPGDEVLVPAWTYIATASMLVASGCRPIFVDADPESYQIDLADAAKRITPNTKAIACTHLYGIPVEVDGVQALAREHGLKVIYDAAQSHLATYKGRGLGEFGDAVTYSFYATKNLGTGEGGMVTVNDDALADKIGLLRSHGERDKYIHESVGFNYRMNDITGAIGCSRLDRLPQETDARRGAAKRYDAIIDEIDGIGRPRIDDGIEPAWHLYTVRIDPDAFTCTRDEFCAAIKAEGVPTAVHYPLSLTDQPAFAEIVARNAADFGDAHPPVARRLAKTVFCLPMHHALSEQDTDDIGEALRKVASAYRR